MDRAALERQIAANPVKGAPDEMRAAFARLAGHRTQVEPREIGGIGGRWFGPPTGPPIIWLHGGGYVFGSSVTHSACATTLAEAAGRGVFVPDYRLAPEAGWPAQRLDALAVLDAVEDPVDVVGDSAGGHLGLHLALARPGRVRHLALISPNTDRTGRSRTRGANSARDLMNDDAMDAALGDMAFANHPAGDPDRSPLGADLTRLPPVFLTATDCEVLLDDSLMLARSLAVAKVPVTLRVEPGLFHMWILWPDALPEARRTLGAIARRFRAT